MSRDLADADIYVSHGGMIPVRWTAPEAFFKKKITDNCIYAASFCWTETCQVGEHGVQQVREWARRNTVYINTIDPASCDGVVYGWRLCFRSAIAGAVIRMSMYRRAGEGDSYHLVNGSVYELTLQSRISSYTCNDRFLDESEYFSVEQGDMVAACWSNNGNDIQPEQLQTFSIS